jgi:hypothetical protein
MFQTRILRPIDFIHSAVDLRTLDFIKAEFLSCRKTHWINPWPSSCSNPANPLANVFDHADIRLLDALGVVGQVATVGRNVEVIIVFLW